MSESQQADLPSRVPVTPPACRACGSQLRIASTEHTRYINIKQVDYVCDCGETRGGLVADNDWFVGSEMALLDRSLALAARDVDEALVWIECQRELIVEMIQTGQATEAAEDSLTISLGLFANMVEHEHRIVAVRKRTTPWYSI
jgi:hypothetical protein